MPSNTLPASLHPLLTKKLPSLYFFQESYAGIIKEGQPVEGPITHQEINPYIEILGEIKKEQKASTLHSQNEVLYTGLKTDSGHFAKYVTPYTTSKTPTEQLAELRSGPLVKNPEEAGIALGTSLKDTQGEQIVLIGERHDQVSQWEFLVGIVRALKNDSRPLVLLLERPLGPYHRYTWTINEWNKGEDRSGLGGAYAREQGYNSLKKFTRAARKRLYPTNIPRGYAYNEISHLRKDAKLYLIDANHPDGTHGRGNRVLRYPFAFRDDVMAVQVHAILQKHPNAIIIGNFGGDHLPETVEDTPGGFQNYPHGANYNDPLGEQLALAYGTEKVHTVVLLPTNADYLSQQSDCKPVCVHDGTVDAVLHIKPYHRRSKWTPPKTWSK